MLLNVGNLKVMQISGQKNRVLLHFFSRLYDYFSFYHAVLSQRPRLLMPMYKSKMNQVCQEITKINHKANPRVPVSTYQKSHSEASLREVT